MPIRPSAKQLRYAIRNLLFARGNGKTLCPSEIARTVAASDERQTWEPLMQPVCEVAYAMADSGELAVTQRGRIVDGRTARGPIRLRLRGNGNSGLPDAG